MELNKAMIATSERIDYLRKYFTAVHYAIGQVIELHYPNPADASIADRRWTSNDDTLYIQRICTRDFNSSNFCCSGAFVEQAQRPWGALVT